jgi:hypothetical protein
VRLELDQDFIRNSGVRLDAEEGADADGTVRLITATP